MTSVVRRVSSSTHPATGDDRSRSKWERDRCGTRAVGSMDW